MLWSPWDLGRVALFEVIQGEFGPGDGGVDAFTMRPGGFGPGGGLRPPRLGAVANMTSINVTSKGVNHVLARHFPGGAKTAGRRHRLSPYLNAGLTLE